jgi:hypothetical protein
MSERVDQTEARGRASALVSDRAAISGS